ncbi:MAG: response regulator [Chloroflexi bacterium]|nr:MAG: response regulator [Chloroflexota bacterium]
MPRVLIADDAQFMRLRLAKLLSRYGFEVLEAANGAEAVHTYCLDRPDVVLMDITMPQMDGLEALQVIRQQDPQARVIMLTAVGQEALALQAIQLGARDYLVKPVDPSRVIDTLQHVLAQTDYGIER